MAMYRFRQLKGSFYNGLTKKTMQPGDVFLYNKRIDQTFPGMVELVADESEPSQELASEPEQEPEIVCFGEDEYRLEGDEASGYYVINVETGKRVSPRKVQRAEVEDLLEELAD